jgi:hypothetical protein
VWRRTTRLGRWLTSVAGDGTSDARAAQVVLFTEPLSPSSFMARRPGCSGRRRANLLSPLCGQWGENEIKLKSVEPVRLFPDERLGSGQRFNHLVIDPEP